MFLSSVHVCVPNKNIRILDFVRRLYMYAKASEAGLVYGITDYFSRCKCSRCPVLSALFSNDEIKSLFAPWKFESSWKFTYGSCSSIDTFDWYFFQLMALLKPDFKCCSNFVLSWVGKVTTGTSIFVCVIAKSELT